ncbi:hypothetical protein [Prosthecochloris sp. ZM_2]|uniref:hypothetical protein n=1 Tax=Prosthecochloris sp. ZM_2 TaxID=2045206 RepID=UPI000F08D103|nr:hypothetical protein [Prosthecochloris sp. ZM_2]
MKISLLKVVAGCAVVLLPFLLVACAESGSVDDGSGEIYDRVSALAEQQEDEAALELIERTVLFDSLESPRAGTASLLELKSRLEERSGRYCRALETHALLDSCCSDQLPGPVRAGHARSYARLLADFGRHRQAADVLLGLGTLSHADQLYLARCYERSGLVAEAAEVYRQLLQARHPAAKLDAASGLLHLSCAYGGDTFSRPAVYAVRTIERARKLLDSPGVASPSAVMALRRAARSLLEAGEYSADASYLLFKALSHARRSGMEAAVALLDGESNAVLKGDPEVYDRTMSWFQEHGMTLPWAMMTVRQSEEPGLERTERLELLRKGVRALSDELPAGASGPTADAFGTAVGRLGALLAESGMYSELFRLDEEMRCREIVDLVHRKEAFSLSGQDIALQKRIAGISRDISALQRRAVRYYETGDGIERLDELGELVSRKRGELNAALTGLGSRYAFEAEKLQPVPVTAATIQRVLRPGQAVLKIVPAGPWLTVYYITHDTVRVTKSGMTAEDFLALARLVTGHLQTGGELGIQTLARHRARLELSEAVAGPFRAELGDLETLTVLSSVPLPVQLLGENRYLARDLAVTYLASARELLWDARHGREQAEERRISFVGADSLALARTLKISWPGDDIVVTWRPYEEQELDDLRVLLLMGLQNGRGLEQVVKEQAEYRRGSGGAEWMTLSVFGAPGAGR